MAVLEHPWRNHDYLRLRSHYMRKHWKTKASNIAKQWSSVMYEKMIELGQEKKIA